jgi:hypothetical protein
MLSGGLMSSGSRLASPRAKTTNSTTKPRKSCKRRWIEKTNPAGNNQKRLALLHDGTDTKVSFQAAYSGLKDPPVGAPILDRAAQRRFAILVTLRQR